MDDTDCPYDYTVRDSFVGASGQQHYPEQSCWDFCSEYINSGAERCSTRKKLSNGGKIYCGYKTGNYLDATTGINSPYRARCNVFISDALMRTVGPWDGTDDTRSTQAGPYLNYWLSDADGISTGSGIDGLCAPDDDEQCAGSKVSVSDAQTRCSQVFDLGTDEHGNCVADICVDGCLDCQVPSPADPDDPGPQVLGNVVDPAVPGKIFSTGPILASTPTDLNQDSCKSQSYASLGSRSGTNDAAVTVTFTVDSGESVLLLATIGPLKHEHPSNLPQNSIFRIIVDGDPDKVVAVSNTGSIRWSAIQTISPRAGIQDDVASLSFHGVIENLAPGSHTAELQYVVRRWAS